MLRCLHVVSDDDRRGAQVFASDLDGALRAQGIDSRVVALAKGAVGGLDVTVLGSRRFDPRTMWRLRRMLTTADVAIAHGSTSVLALAMATMGTRVPFVVRQISETRFWVNSLARRLRVRAYLSRAARVVALAPSAAATLHEHLGIPQRRTRVVPNGVPRGTYRPPSPSERLAARRALGADPKQPTLVYVGALVPEKGADVALGAAVAVGCQLVVAGDGPERARLERIAADTGRPESIVFAGSLRSPLAAYHAADAVVLPSRAGDSMPAVLIEAGFCAVPAVATDVGAISDIVLDSTTGRVTARGDDAAFVEAVRELMSDEKTRTAMGRAAEAHCLEHFEIGVVAEQWRAVLEEAAGRRTGRPGARLGR